MDNQRCFVEFVVVCCVLLDFYLYGSFIFSMTKCRYCAIDTSTSSPGAVAKIIFLILQGRSGVFVLAFPLLIAGLTFVFATHAH